MLFGLVLKERDVVLKVVQSRKVEGNGSLDAHVWIVYKRIGADWVQQMTDVRSVMHDSRSASHQETC